MKNDIFKTSSEKHVPLLNLGRIRNVAGRCCSYLRYIINPRVVRLFPERRVGGALQPGLKFQDADKCDAARLN